MGRSLRERPGRCETLLLLVLVFAIETSRKKRKVIVQERAQIFAMRFSERKSRVTRKVETREAKAYPFAPSKCEPSLNFETKQESSLESGLVSSDIQISRSGFLRSQREEEKKDRTFNLAL